MDRTAKILIVDDREDDLRALEKMLKGVEAELVLATTGNQALQFVLEEEFALALIDVQMPGMDGYETLELLRQQGGTEGMPVILISAVYSGERHHVRGVETGAVDFIEKPINAKVLRGKIAVFLKLYQQMKDLDFARLHLEKALADERLEREKAETTLASLQSLHGWQRGSIAATLAGVGPLREREPERDVELCQRYEEVFDLYLEMLAYKKALPRDRVNGLATALGDLYGGPRDVVDLHVRVMEGKAKSENPKKLNATLVEGRLFVIELMGYLVEYYRNRYPLNTLYKSQ